MNTFRQIVNTQSNTLQNCWINYFNNLNNNQDFINFINTMEEVKHVQNSKIINSILYTWQSKDSNIKPLPTNFSATYENDWQSTESNIKPLSINTIYENTEDLINDLIGSDGLDISYRLYSSYMNIFNLLQRNPEYLEMYNKYETMLIQQKSPFLSPYKRDRNYLPREVFPENFNWDSFFIYNSFNEISYEASCINFNYNNFLEIYSSIVSSPSCIFLVLYLLPTFLCVLIFVCKFFSFRVKKRTIS